MTPYERFMNTVMDACKKYAEDVANAAVNATAGEGRPNGKWNVQFDPYSFSSTHATYKCSNCGAINLYSPLTLGPPDRCCRCGSINRMEETKNGPYEI